MFTILAAAAPAAQSGKPAKAGQAINANYEDLKWQLIVPELAAASPQIAVCASTRRPRPLSC